MDITYFYGSVIAMVLLLIPIKELKKEYFVIAAAALSLILTVVALKWSTPIFDYLRLLSDNKYSEYFKVMIKVFGIAFITNITSDMVSDLGMSSVSGKVEFVGKVAIIVSSLPIFDQLFVKVINIA